MNSEADIDTTIQEVSSFFWDVGISTGLQFVAVGLALLFTPLVIGAEWPNPIWSLTMVFISIGLAFLVYLAQQTKEREVYTLWVLHQLAPLQFSRDLVNGWSAFRSTGAFVELRRLSMIFPTLFSIVGILVVFGTLLWNYRPQDYVVSYTLTISLTLVMTLGYVLVFRLLKHRKFLPNLEKRIAGLYVAPVINIETVRLVTEQGVTMASGITVDEDVRPDVREFLDAHLATQSGTCVSQWFALPNIRDSALLRIDFVFPYEYRLVFCFDRTEQTGLFRSISKVGSIGLHTQNAGPLILDDIAPPDDLLDG